MGTIAILRVRFLFPRLNPVTKMNQVKQIKWYTSSQEGCRELGMFPRLAIPLNDFAFHCVRRSTPWNMPTTYFVEEDMPLTFNWHVWRSCSYQAVD